MLNSSYVIKFIQDKFSVCLKNFQFRKLHNLLCYTGSTAALGASGSMRGCHAAGPGSIPGRDRFPR